MIFSYWLSMLEMQVPVRVPLNLEVGNGGKGGEQNQKQNFLNVNLLALLLAWHCIIEGHQYRVEELKTLNLEKIKI